MRQCDEWICSAVSGATRQADKFHYHFECRPFLRSPPDASFRLKGMGWRTRPIFASEAPFTADFRPFVPNDSQHREARLCSAHFFHAPRPSCSPRCAKAPLPSSPGSHWMDVHPRGSGPHADGRLVQDRHDLECSSHIHAGPMGSHGT